MKRLCLIGLILAFVVSCKDDDDQIIIQCEIPTNLSVSSISDVSATVSWENNNETQNVKVEYGLSGFVIGNGTILEVSENSITLSNLNPNSVYDFYVQALCEVDNISMISSPFSFNTEVSQVVAELLPTLSEMNLFLGNLQELNMSPNVFEYKLNTALYTDYAHKQRILSLPEGTSLQYDGDGLPIFPEGTVLAKTFYYNLDETNLTLGKKVIETRILIRKNNVWQIGNYLWNDSQDEAFLDEEAHVVPITWINENGEEISIDYEVPDNDSCIMCHQNNGNKIPIGPKLRSMNFEFNGINQLQKFINDGHLINAPNVSSISSLPSWENTSLSDAERTRAYFDVNCAHCHSPGGLHNTNYFGTMDFRFETPFEDSKIFEKRYSIMARFQSSIPGYSMPFIGVSLPHQEAIDLIIPYLESLE